jgi:DNA-binding NtrC family response regulator
MRNPSDDNSEFGRAPVCDSEMSDVDECALDRFLEYLSEAGCLTLLQWARRHAPALLRTLIVSFLTRASVSELRKASDQCSLPEASPTTGTITSSKAATLRAIEQQHIARVIAESPTLSEAASRLGVASTTLWRKRKLYDLVAEGKLADEKPHS